MGFFGRNRSGRQLWSQRRPKPAVLVKPTEVKMPSGLPSWRKNQKVYQQVREAQDKTKEKALLDAERDSVLEVTPEERPKVLPPKRFASMSVLSIIVFLALMVRVGLEIRHTQLGREVSSLTNKKVVLIEENRRLRADFDKLLVVEDLERVARETLGLVLPDEGQIIILR